MQATQCACTPVKHHTGPGQLTGAKLRKCTRNNAHTHHRDHHTTPHHTHAQTATNTHTHADAVSKSIIQSPIQLITQRITQSITQFYFDAQRSRCRYRSGTLLHESLRTDGSARSCTANTFCPVCTDTVSSTLSTVHHWCSQRVDVTASLLVIAIGSTLSRLIGSHHISAHSSNQLLDLAPRPFPSSALRLELRLGAFSLSSSVPSVVTACSS